MEAGASATTIASLTCRAMEWGTLKQNQTGLECPPIWDGFSCWGPTAPGEIASSRCPSFKGSDVTKSAFRICGQTGKWLDREGIPSSVGWTNYTSCLTPEIREIMRRLGSNDDAQVKFNIAKNTRILEFVGLSLSLTALLLSLIIFYYFRTLRNSRTRLHRHLFIAMVIQVAIRLIVYTDQAITRNMAVGSNVNPNVTHRASNGIPTRRGIDNTPILCEASYISLEYARTAMFMWMFVEGLFLHNMITVTVFEEKLSPFVYPVIGWIVPVPLTVAWATLTHFHYGSATCWWGYNFTLYFWILEGPRLAVLMINLAFLLNILRVLIMKLRQSNSSEMQQALKAVKAALVLLPLLGLTNLLNMLDAPLEKSPIQFALWSYTTHALTSTQGFILAFLYCFRNGEVQMAIRKFFRIRILGNSKHRVMSKKAIPMSALDNASILQADSGAVSQSQSLNLNHAQRIMRKLPSRSDQVGLHSNKNDVPLLKNGIDVQTIVRSYSSNGVGQKPGAVLKMDSYRGNHYHQNANSKVFYNDSTRCPLLLKSNQSDLSTSSPVNNSSTSSLSKSPLHENIYENKENSERNACYATDDSKESISGEQQTKSQMHMCNWRMLIIPDLLLKCSSNREYQVDETKSVSKQKRWKRDIRNSEDDSPYDGRVEEELASEDVDQDEASSDFVSIEISQHVEGGGRDITSLHNCNEATKECGICCETTSPVDNKVEHIDNGTEKDGHTGNSESLKIVVDI